MGAFACPPTAKLDAEGYYSWPGSRFRAERQQRRYAARLAAVARQLGVRLDLASKPLDEDSQVDGFTEQMKTRKPDGLLLIPFNKGHWPKAVRIGEQTGVPAVVLARLGVLLVDHINQLHRRPGVYLIRAMDDFDNVGRA